MALNDVIFQVPLPQMLDLALGTPEVGSVNFNILHNFLHIILRQTSLNNAKAEYRGDDANRIKAMVASLNDGPNFYLHENDIIDIGGNIVQRDWVPDSAVVTANVYAIDDQIPQKNDETDYKDTDNAPKAKMVEDLRQIDGTDSGQELIDVNLSEEVVRINNRLTEIEMNFEYLNDNITNLYEIINVPHPLEHEPSFATEKNSLTKDGEEDNKVEEEEEEGEEEEKVESEKVKSSGPSDDKISDEEQIADMKSSVQASRVSGLTTASLAAGRASRQFSRSFNYTAQLNELKEDLGSLKNDMMKIMQDVAETRYHVDQLRADKEALEEEAAEKEALVGDIDDAVEIKSVGHVSSEASQTASEAENFIDEVVDISSITTLPGSKILSEDQSDDGDDRKSSRKHVSRVSLISKPEEYFADKDLKVYKEKEKSLIEMTENVKSRHEENLKNIDYRIKTLERKINFDELEGIEGIQDIVRNIKDIEIDVEKINIIIDNLNKEKETREQNMNIMIEQIELLKIMKADGEDLEDALANKADAILVNRKVSYDRFDSACKELAHALEDATLKSNKQETLWKEALDSVQQEIDSKLDKTDVSPIQEYMNEKLQALQDKLKELTVKKRENEAAGAKKILTDLQCIVCDKDVIMKMEQKALDYPDPMPYRKNIKPYLTYKLDQTRKHQRQFPAKHINQVTAAVQEMNKNKFSTNNIMEKSSKDHFCNRYCGGSHTITTPHQRVMRMGHFFAEWGPEIIQLTEGVVRGNDGQLYHGRSMPPGVIDMPGEWGLDQNACYDKKT